MGARPEQQLAFNFLSAVHDLWLQYPGLYAVAESTNDLVPALAQMCIKALAGDVRDGTSPESQQEIAINGCLLDSGQPTKGDGAIEPLNLRDVVNKIIHGTATSVEVREETVLLHFKNSAHDRWTDAWFSATQLLKELERILYKHRNRNAEIREREIAEFLRTLGVQRFLPSPIPGEGLLPSNQ